MNFHPYSRKLRVALASGLLLIPTLAGATNITYMGTLAFNISVAVKTPFPNGTAVDCTAYMDYGQLFQEESATETTVSNGAATCQVNIPYSWTLSGSPIPNLSYEIQAESGTQFRSTSQTLSQHITLPNSDITTEVTVDATL